MAGERATWFGEMWFCHQSLWKSNIQKHKQTWVKTLPAGFMGKGRSPGGDCDEGGLVLVGAGALSVGTGEHPQVAPTRSSPGRSQ